MQIYTDELQNEHKSLWMSLFINIFVSEQAQMYIVDYAQYQLAMGRNTKQDKKVESQSQEEVEEVEQGNQDDALEDPYLESDNDNAHHQQLLSQLQKRVQQTKNGQQLTWAALYSLKQQQLDLNEKMNEQIQALKDQYQLLKQPLYKLVSDVALGIRVKNQLYQLQGIQNKVNCNVAPQKIQDFWGIVFDKERLISQAIDVDSFKKLQEFNCQIVDQTSNHIRIYFKFNAETQYFTNRELTLDVKYNEELGPSRQIKEEIKYKKERVEHSIFTLLFDSKTNIQECYNVACEIYQNYSNAIYFYFRQDEEDEDNQPFDVDGNEEEEDEGEESEHKPAKKAKANVQKPECKQQ